MPIEINVERKTEEVEMKIAAGISKEEVENRAPWRRRTRVADRLTPYNWVRR